MKALVGAFNQEKALVGAFSVIVEPVVEPMDRFTALLKIDNFILKRILIYSHDLPNQQQLHKPDDSIITRFRAEHVPYHSDYLGLTLASADGLTVMMTQ